jgi:hypothetical protein
MYDLWESLLLESELESQVNKKDKNIELFFIIIIHYIVFKENGMFYGKGNLWSIRKFYNK